jgi:MFS family permease
MASSAVVQVASEAKQPDKQQQPPYPSNFYAWYCVFVLLGIYLNSFLDRQIISLLVGPIKATMSLSDSQVGFLMGPAFAIFYTIAGLPLGWLADRMSRRLLIGIGQVFWSIASVSFGFGRNYTQMLSARIGVGVGEASLSPSAYSMIADVFPPARLGRALSVYAMGIYLGGGLANVIGGQLSEYYAPAELHDFPLVGQRLGWQIVFFMIALPTIPLTLMLLTIKEPFRRGIGMRRDAQGNLKPVSVPMREFAKYWWANRRATLSHAVGFSLLSFSGYGVAAWAPAFYMRLHGWTPAKVGTYLGLMAMIVGPLGLLSAGWLADRWSARGMRDAKMRVGLLAAVVWFPFGIASPLMPTGELAFLCYIPAFYFASFSWGIAPAAVQELMPNQMRGQASAVYLFVINLVGLGLGPWLLALVTDHVFADENQVHLSMLFTTTTAHTLSATLLWLGLPAFRRSRDNLDRWLAQNG